MKRRKSVLTIACMAYILVAICATALFLIKNKNTGSVPAVSDNVATKQALVTEETKVAQAATKVTQTATKETQTATKETQTATKETQTATKETQAATKETQTATKETQTATKETQTATKETQTATKKTEPATVAASPLLNGTYEVICHAVSKQGSVNMRKAPDNAGAVAGWIPQNGECEVLLEDVQGWMLVRYDGYTGFVYKKYLEKK